jgi:type I restriction enzyme M protein
LLDEAAGIKNAVAGSKERLKRKKKDKAPSDVIGQLKTEIQEKQKAARELESRAADIDAAVFDLKAVNPNTVAKVDTRTPQQIIGNIEKQGRVVSESLGRLNKFLAAADGL